MRYVHDSAQAHFSRDLRDVLSNIRHGQWTSRYDLRARQIRILWSSTFVDNEEALLHTTVDASHKGMVRSDMSKPALIFFSL
jgi:hypothetical protein